MASDDLYILPPNPSEADLDAARARMWHEYVEKPADEMLEKGISGPVQVPRVLAVWIRNLPNAADLELARAQLDGDPEVLAEIARLNAPPGGGLNG